MAVVETLVLYVVAGVAVAVALSVREGTVSPLEFCVHLLLWPFFTAALFDRNGGSGRRAPSEARSSDDQSEAESLHPEIRRAESKLLAALSRLDGLAEDVLGSERERIRSLTDSLDAMQSRLNEMDDLLGSDAFDEEEARAALQSAEEGDATPERVESLRSQLRYIHRLQRMRADLRDDLRTALSKVDEITTQISLLRFADQPEREVSALIEDIAATVDGLSEGVLEEPPGSGTTGRRSAVS